MLVCTLKANSEAARKSLRLKHLEYLQAHREKIVFGGPALNAENAPEMMVIAAEFPDLKAVEDFVNQEPYTASGEVFESVKIRRWSQVLPETSENALDEEIEKERGK